MGAGYIPSEFYLTRRTRLPCTKYWVHSTGSARIITTSYYSTIKERRPEPVRVTRVVVVEVAVSIHVPHVATAVRRALLPASQIRYMIVGSPNRQPE